VIDILNASAPSIPPIAADESNHGRVGEGRAAMKRQHRDQRGVTLVELMVVVAILAIIAAIAVTLYQDLQKKARLSADQGTMAALRSAAAIYFGKNDGAFPTQNGLNSLVQPSPPVMQCPSASWSLDTVNGKVTYTPNDTGAC
jgi:prepilin-type N-terminal cleavage/methylation domain-containing protein